MTYSLLCFTVIYDVGSLDSNNKKYLIILRKSEIFQTICATITSDSMDIAMNCQHTKKLPLIV